MPRYRIPLTVAIWTTALAVPAALLGLVGVALLDETLPQIALSLSRFDWRAISVETSARWPELAGMLVGQALILAILLFLRERRRAPAD
jgi:hypothetical protein